MAKAPEAIVLRINIPNLKLQKAIRVSTSDPVWSVSRQLEDKVATDIKDILNYGLFVHGKDGRNGKFLDERNTVGSYHLGATVRFPTHAPDPSGFYSQMQNWRRARREKAKEINGRN
jgi:hypothetical protein